MKRFCFAILLLFFLWLFSFPGESASAIWIGINSIHILPEHPNDLDSVTVYINGEISTPCDSIWYDHHEIQGSRIDLHLQFYDYQDFCPDVIAPFYLQIPIGTLPAGLCTLYVIVDSYSYFWGMIFEVTDHITNPTGITDSPQDLIDQFALFQNYPNPFNSSTIISDEIMKAGVVTLKIYNILGREVRSLVNSVQKPGNYRVLWDGKNKQGKEVGSGIYFYELKVGDYKETRKLVFIK
jgi:hypothetical protein